MIWSWDRDCPCPIGEPMKIGDPVMVYLFVAAQWVRGTLISFDTRQWTIEIDATALPAYANGDRVRRCPGAGLMSMEDYAAFLLTQ